jgi:uncharacterized protein YjeT (DUF2065 family)
MDQRRWQEMIERLSDQEKHSLALWGAGLVIVALLAIWGISFLRTIGETPLPSVEGLQGNSAIRQDF